jgi:elongation factor P
MDVDTFEQPALTAAILGDVLPYLKEGTTLELESYEGEPIGIELPITVELTVTDAPPGYAGDTATGATKEVTLETGMKLLVPLFVNTGDVLRIDTRTGEYLTRV